MSDVLERKKVRKTRVKLAVVTWIAVYPLVTLLLWALGPLVRNLPLPVVTLILSLILVSILSFLVMPLMQRLFRSWVNR
jgi:antibiotic biosynthesis monooxygenase (ABM) superfamily enzyme